MGQATEETTLLDNKRGSVTARQAFEGADATASRVYHESKLKGESTEAHQAEGGLLKPIIFGGLDGILTSFAIVAGSAGGNLSPNVVLVLGSCCLPGSDSCNGSEPDCSVVTWSLISCEYVWTS